MKVLVVGGGGREHAIIEALHRSQADLYTAMSNQNPGIRRRSKDVLLGDVTDVERIVSWAKGHGIELAVVGPEAPLEKGVTDALEAAAIPTVGPSREAAQLETNKEFTLQAFCDGRVLVPMPLAQDHKRAYEGDKGPNTGGMGSYSDADHRLPFLTKEDFDRALETMTKTVEAMASRGTPFKGILYGGFMATRDGPMLLEYNVRFADPESMNVLPILETDFLDVCSRHTAGTLPSAVSFARKATGCKYVVPLGDA